MLPEVPPDKDSSSCTVSKSICCAPIATLALCLKEGSSCQGGSSTAACTQTLCLNVYSMETILEHLLMFLV